MNTYKIILVKNEFVNFIKEYPESLKILLLNEKSMFDSKQLQLLFDSTDKAYEYCRSHLFLREDYQFFHGIHQLENEITHDVVTFVFNQYDIEVTEKVGSFVVFDDLKKFSSNFFMINI